MPKGAETKMAYKVSITGGELKIVFFGLVTSGSVISPEAALKKLRGGSAFEYITCRNDVKMKLLELWAEKATADPPPAVAGNMVEVSHSQREGLGE